MAQPTPNSVPNIPPRGEHAVKVDSAGRLKLPAKYQEHLNRLPIRTLFVTIVFDSLRVYTNTSWEDSLDEINRDPAKRKLVQAIRTEGDRNGQDVEMDPHGRITLPQKVREKWPLADTTLHLRFQGGVIMAYTESQWAAAEKELDEKNAELKRQAEEAGWL